MGHPPTDNQDFTGDTQDIYSAGSLFDTPNRELHPTQGRWISPDPAGSAWNRYGYVTNDPLSLTDPDGLFGQRYDPGRIYWPIDIDFDIWADYPEPWMPIGTGRDAWVDLDSLPPRESSWILNIPWVRGSTLPGGFLPGDEVPIGPDLNFERAIRAIESVLSGQVPDLWGFFPEVPGVSGPPIEDVSPAENGHDPALRSPWLAGLLGFFEGFSGFGLKNDPRPSCLWNFLKETGRGFVGSFGPPSGNTVGEVASSSGSAVGATVAVLDYPSEVGIVSAAHLAKYGSRISKFTVGGKAAGRAGFAGLLANLDLQGTIALTHEYTDATSGVCK